MPPFNPEKVPEEKQAELDALIGPIATKALQICLDERTSSSDNPEATELQKTTELILTELQNANATRLQAKWLKKLMFQATSNSLIATFNAPGEKLDDGSERYSNATVEFLKIILEEHVPMKLIPKDELEGLFQGVGVKLLAKAKELGLNMVEVDWVFGRLQNLVMNVCQNVEGSIETAYVQAVSKTFDVIDPEYVTIKQIIDIQQK